MKKILLSVGLFSLVLVGRAQTVLNEVYVEPGAGKHEFFELYNSGAGAQNLDCFTLVTYWESGANSGWYVIDFPNLPVASKGFFTGAAADPFNVQAQVGVDASFSWNDAAFLAANNGYLRSYQVNGGGYNPPTIPANLNDLLYKANIGGVFYATLLFQNGVFINGFLGGDADGILHANLQALPDLSVDMSGGCADFIIDFSALPKMEFVNSSPGNDNGYSREFDGKCGSWKKNAPGVSHTPNVTNGTAGSTGELATAEVLFCNSLPAQHKSHVQFDITGVTGGATEIDDFPVEVQLYYDYAPLGLPIGPEDIYQRSEFIATIAATPDTFQIAQTQYVLLVYKTKRGCFDKVVSVANSCAPLPVSFKSFTATRFSSNVMVKWETAWEQNNSGFAVERNINGTWQQVAWVASQAVGGNSTDVLSYSFNDPNNVKGISQYRIRQQDMDSKSKYSDVRSVRGEGQLSKTTVYPNPTNDGKVMVMFEDASASRNVTVMDMSGRIVKEFKAIKNNNITIENLQPGVYTIKVSVPETGEQAVQKIVVNQR